MCVFAYAFVKEHGKNGVKNLYFFPTIAIFSLRCVSRLVTNHSVPSRGKVNEMGKCTVCPGAS